MNKREKDEMERASKTLQWISLIVSLIALIGAIQRLA